MNHYSQTMSDLFFQGKKKMPACAWQEPFLGRIGFWWAPKHQGVQCGASGEAGTSKELTHHFQFRVFYQVLPSENEVHFSKHGNGLAGLE